VRTAARTPPPPWRSRPARCCAAQRWCSPGSLGANITIVIIIIVIIIIIIIINGLRTFTSLSSSSFTTTTTTINITIIIIIVILPPPTLHKCAQWLGEELIADAHRHDRYS
jgi:hypothetical protein